MSLESEGSEALQEAVREVAEVPLPLRVERLLGTRRVMLTTRGPGWALAQSGRVERATRDAQGVLSVEGEPLRARLLLPLFDQGCFEAGGLEALDGEGRLCLALDEGGSGQDRLRRLARLGASAIPLPAAPVWPSLPEEEVVALRAAWDCAAGPAGFARLLLDRDLPRCVVLRHAGPLRARPLRTQALVDVLEALARGERPVTLWMQSDLALQGLRGALGEVRFDGERLTLESPGSALALDLAGLSELYVVKRPTPHGTQTSLEAFSADGAPRLLLFSAAAGTGPDDPAFTAVLDLAG